MKAKSIFLSIVLVAILAGCNQFANTKGEKEAQLLSDRADECLLDVRDRRIGFTQSKNCQLLGGIVSTLLNQGVPSSWSQKAQLDFAAAQRSAWIAVALNNYRAALGVPWTLVDSIW